MPQVSSVWRVRLLVFAAHLVGIAIVIVIVSKIGQPAETDQIWREMPRNERIINPEFVAGGEPIFAQYCAACHGRDGGGATCPSLTDQEWLHGSSLNDIIVSVSSGFPEKGMAAWNEVLGEMEIEQVAVFVHSLEKL